MSSANQVYSVALLHSLATDGNGLYSQYLTWSCQSQIINGMHLRGYQTNHICKGTYIVALSLLSPRCKLSNLLRGRR